MPRKSRKSARPATRAKPSKSTATKGNGEIKYTVEDILDKAQSSIDTYDFDMAQRFCQKALEMDSDNVRALETTGLVMLEVQNLDAAKQCFGRCVELEPNSGHTKYMYLGQLLTGVESVQCYQKGIELMVNLIEAQENNPAATSVISTPPTKRDVSSAYLSIAELYMTDLCDEEDAETQCTTHIHKSIEYDDSNPEGYQVLADYYLIKAQIPEAKENIQKSVSLWLPCARSLVTPDDTATSPAVENPVDPIPISTDAQIKAAKTMIEVELYSDATDILELLLDQDDTLVEVWYMLGLANYLQGEEFYVTSKYYLQKCEQLMEKQQYDDSEVIQHVSELMTELVNVDTADTEDPADCELVISSEDEAMDEQ